MPDLAPFRLIARCLDRPRRYEALLTLCGKPLTPTDLAGVLGMSSLEILPLLADLTRAGLVYTRELTYHPTDFAFQACSFAARCAKEAEDRAREKRAAEDEARKEKAKVVGNGVGISV